MFRMCVVASEYQQECPREGTRRRERGSRRRESEPKCPRRGVCQREPFVFDGATPAAGCMLGGKGGGQGHMRAGEKEADYYYSTPPWNK